MGLIESLAIKQARKMGPGTESYDWDFFIAHAGADKATAEKLYDLLAGRSRVFLDSRCLHPGDEWDTALRAAQKASLISVILVSAHTEEAYYQREEIAAALALARKSEHRVVPLYLDEDAAASENVPYGLRLKQGLRLFVRLLIVRLRQRAPSVSGEGRPWCG